LKLQSVQIGQQVVDLLLREHLAEALHIVAAQADDVADSVVICGHSTNGEVLSLEDSLQARPFTIFGRVGGMTAIAILIVDVPPGSLLRIQPELGITVPALDFAGQQRVKKAAQKKDCSPSEF